MSNLATGYVSIEPDARGFGPKLDRDLSRVNTAPAGKVMGRKVGAGMHEGLKGSIAEFSKGLMGPLLGLFAIEKVHEFFSMAIEGASNTSEQTNKVGVVFGESAEKIRKAAETSAKAMGLSEEAYLGAAGTLGNLFVSMKLPQPEAAKMSTRMIKLAADMASFNNTRPEDALKALQAGLVGQVRPLRQYGVNLNAATIKAEALSLGLVKATGDTGKIQAAQIRATIAQQAYTKAVHAHGINSEQARTAQMHMALANIQLGKAMKGTVPALTAQQKAVATYHLILDQTKTAQGDFARTSGGLANQQRILRAEFDDLVAKVGKELLPIVTEFTKYLTANVVPILLRVAEGFGAVVHTVLQHTTVMKYAAAAVLALYAANKIHTAYMLVQMVGGLKVYILQMNLVSLATKAWTVAQTILNVALGNNPIGITIKVLAALVVGLIIAYKTSATFRGIVQGAWSGIKSAVGAAWTGIQGVFSALHTWITKTLAPAVTGLYRNVVIPAWAGIRAAISTAWHGLQPIFGAIDTVFRRVIGPTVLWYWHNVTVPAFKGIWSAVKGAWGIISPLVHAFDTVIRRVIGPSIMWWWRNVTAPALAGIWAAVRVAWSIIHPILQLFSDIIRRVVGVTIMWWWHNVTVPAMRGIWTTISGAWGIIHGIFNAMNTLVRKVLGPTFTWLRDSVVRPVWNGLSSIVRGAWNSTLYPVLNALGNFVKNTLAPRFRQGVSAISTAWNGLKAVAKAPVNFLIGTLYDKGIRGLFNKVASVVGSKARLPYFAPMASGGPITGGVPGKDSVPILGMPGEFVVRTDGSNLHEALAHFGAPAYSIGGWISDKVHAIAGGLRGAAGSVIGGAKSAVGGVKNVLGDVGGWIQGMLGKASQAILGNIRGLLGGLGSSPLGGLLHSGGSFLIDALKSFITGQDKAAPGGGGAYTGPVPGGGAVTRWSRTVLSVLSALHQSPSWLATVLRRMNQESGGNPNAINLWDVNAKNGVPSQGLMQVIPPTFAAYAGAYRGMGIRNPFANVYAGLNYAIHRYGSLSALNRPGGYRDGGLLNPGQLGLNETRKPERVLSHQQTLAFDRLVEMLDSGEVGRGMQVHVTNNHPVAEPASVTVNRAIQFTAALGR